jgi:hypothetical protein
MCNVYPMEMKIVLGEIQPYRLSVAKKEDFMAAARQF